MTTSIARVRNFIADESGATAIEYGLLAALIGVIIIVGAYALGTNLNLLFGNIAKCIADPKNACSF